MKPHFFRVVSTAGTLAAILIATSSAGALDEEVSLPQLSITNRGEALERQECEANLRTIHTAIQSFRRTHKKLPDWLSDLLPSHVNDPEVLFCPVTRRTGQTRLFGIQDPKVNTSYIYEFCAQPLPEAVWGGSTMRMKDWKSLQMAVVGGDTPMLRCHMHPAVLNVGFDGRVYNSGVTWELQFGDVVEPGSLSPQALAHRFQTPLASHGPGEDAGSSALEVDQHGLGGTLEDHLHNLGHRGSRHSSARTLAERGGEAVPGLLQALEAESAIVREGVVLTLGWIGHRDERVLPALLRSLRDPDPVVRTRVAHSLSDFLRGTAKVRPVPDRASFITEPALSAEEAASTTRALTRALQQERHYNARRAMVISLRWLGPLGAEALPLLIRLTEQDPSVRESTVFALGFVGALEPEVVPVLEAALTDASASVRREAIFALRRIAVPAEMDVLPIARRLADSDPRVRHAAAQTLAHLGPKAHAAIPHLRAALDDPRQDVRDVVAMALVELEGQPNELGSHP